MNNELLIFLVMYLWGMIPTHFMFTVSGDKKHRIYNTVLTLCWPLFCAGIIGYILFFKVYHLFNRKKQIK